MVMSLSYFRSDIQRVGNRQHDFNLTAKEEEKNTLSKDLIKHNFYKMYYFTMILTVN